MDIRQRKKVLTYLAQKASEDSIALDAIRKEVNEISRKLELETQYDIISAQITLLDTIAFVIDKQAIEVFSVLLKRLKNISLTYQTTSAYPLEKIQQHQNQNKLIIQILESLRHIRYFDIQIILNIFLEYSIHADLDVIKQAIRCIESLTQYDLGVFYGDGNKGSGLGWLPQESVLAAIHLIPPSERKKYLTGILSACKEILSPSIEGATSTYNKVIIQTASLPALDGIKELRIDVLALLKSIYPTLNNTEDKIRLLKTMQSSTQISRANDRKEEFLKMIADSTIFILQFMNTIVSSEELQVMQTIEHDAYWYFYHMGIFDPQIKKLALSIRNQLFENREYQKFRILIGFESIFHDWEKGNEKDFYEQEQAFREQKGLEFAQEINEKNYIEWKTRIINFANLQSNDMATFPYFAKFLDNLGKESPKIALRLLTESHEELNRFIVPLLCGLECSGELTEIYRLINIWTAQDSHLLYIARFFEFSSDINESLFEKLFKKAKESKDLNVLSQIIVAVSEQYKIGRENLIKDFLIPSIEFCTKQKNASWIFSFWYKNKRKIVLQAMDEKDYQKVLNNLIWLNQIDYQAEEVLFPIAEKSPLLVLKFFCDRIALKKTNDKFEAIPFQFTKLSEPLSVLPEQVVDIILSVKPFNEELFTYKVVRLLKIIFQKFSEHPLFENKLIQLVHTGDENNIIFVLNILRNYKGEPSLHSICKETIKIAHDNKELLNQVCVVLQSTGVVSGEYGFVEEYQRKIKEIESWLDDDDPNIILFAKNYISDLENYVELELKRANEDIALRKHQYGSDDE